MGVSFRVQSAEFKSCCKGTPCSGAQLVTHTYRTGQRPSSSHFSKVTGVGGGGGGGGGEGVRG